MARAAKREPGGARRPSSAAPSAALTAAHKLELYYWMRLTRSLEERLLNLQRQGKLVGGLFRSLGQEADAVGSAYALAEHDFVSSLTRNLGALLVRGLTPVEVLRQQMGRADSLTRARDLGLHLADLSRGFIGHISPLGDMVAVMAGVTLSFKMRGEDRAGLVYVG
ncbi:MAG: thiamine pyrophosphate-dependent enzyme, partial [Gemmatimonadales bacterium]